MIREREKPIRLSAAYVWLAAALAAALCLPGGAAADIGKPVKVFEGDLYLYDLVEETVTRLTHYEDELNVVSVDWEGERALFLGPREKKYSLGFDGTLEMLTSGTDLAEMTLPGDPTRKVGILHNEVQVSNLDGTEREILTSQLGFRDNAWPDGDWIYYTFRSFRSTDSVLAQLRRVPVEGGDEVTLAGNVAGTCLPAVSSDGERILVIAGTRDLDGDERIGSADLALHVLRPATGEMEFLEGAAQGNQAPVWIRGERQAFYQRRKSDGRTLRVFDLESGAGRDLYALRGIPRIAYSKQLNVLLFNEDRRLMRIDLPDGEARKVEGLDYDERIEWRPALGWFNINPEGDRALIARGRERTLTYGEYQNYRRERAARRRDAN